MDSDGLGEEDAFAHCPNLLASEKGSGGQWRVQNEGPADYELPTLATPLPVVSSPASEPRSVRVSARSPRHTSLNV